MFLFVTRGRHYSANAEIPIQTQHFLTQPLWTQRPNVELGPLSATGQCFGRLESPTWLLHSFRLNCKDSFVPLSFRVRASRAFLRHRFSAFWLRSKCSICSYQLNIWYEDHASSSILIWFLSGESGSVACNARFTGWPCIAVPQGSAHFPTYLTLGLILLKSEEMRLKWKILTESLSVHFCAVIGPFSSPFWVLSKVILVHFDPIWPNAESIFKCT